MRRWSNLPVLRRDLLWRSLLTLLLAFAFSQILKIVETHFEPTPSKSVSYGVALSHKGINTLGTRVLLIATSDKCAHSIKSISFHEKVIALAHASGIHVLVVSPRWKSIPDPVISMLDSRDLVEKWGAQSLNISATPTVLLVEHGVVRGAWVGRLDKPQEEALLRRMEGTIHTLIPAQTVGQGYAPPEPTRYNTSQLEGRLTRSIILDPQTREDFRQSHLRGAINIPRDEFSSRTQIELPRKRDELVIDCSPMEYGACVLLGNLLQHWNYRNVWLLNAGANGGSCHRTTI